MRIVLSAVAAQMPDLSEFESGRSKRARLDHPKGFEPGLTWRPEDGGTITAQLDAEPDDSVWAMLIADWGLDPSRTQVVDGSLQIRAWDTFRDGEPVRLRYYRATIRPREAVQDRADIDELCRLAMRRRPRAAQAAVGGRAMVVLLADWQTGKGEGGGSPALVARVLSFQDRLLLRLAELKKAGRGVSAVYLVGLGDLIEQCSGHYAMQAFQTDLDRREQMRLARRLILGFVDRLVDAGYQVVLGAVPGNHGENRNAAGKAFTSWTDNDDLALFDGVSEITAANPARYGSVSVPLGAIASDLTMVLDVEGVVCGFAHGHQFARGAGGSVAKIEAWLKGQALGRQPIGDVDILFSGHYHHFVCSESTGRTVFQSPASDGGSHWFTSQTGAGAPPGLLTMLVGSGCGTRGWSDLAIL